MTLCVKLFESELLLELINASTAYTLAVKVNYVINVVAENTGGLIFFENDLVAVSKNFKCILGLYIQHVADLNGQNDSSELVYLANNTSRFHKLFSLNKKQLLKTLTVLGGSTRFRSI